MDSSKKILKNILIIIIALLILFVIYLFFKQFRKADDNIIEKQNATNIQEGNKSNESKTLPPLNINLEENFDLRRFLSDVVYFNARNNGVVDGVADLDTSDEDFYDGVKLSIACGLVTYSKRNKIFNDEPKEYKFEMTEVNKALKEFIGINVSEAIKSESSLVEYNESKNAYVYKEAGDETTSGYIVKILNQTNSNGIYKITLLYSYPEEGDFIDNNIDNYECYRTAIELKVNEDYEYSKYQLVSTLPLESIEAGKIGDYK